ncbi:MAG: hypothetical protein D6746_01530 [Bacteroidetes bacterium]|nr:MAG: hypothetical protein D6746_01530 [Bacteroidota bacterium]
MYTVFYDHAEKDERIGSLFSEGKVHQPNPELLVVSDEFDAVIIKASIIEDIRETGTYEYCHSKKLFLRGPGGPYQASTFFGEECYRSHWPSLRALCMNIGYDGFVSINRGGALLQTDYGIHVGEAMIFPQGTSIPEVYDMAEYIADRYEVSVVDSLEGMGHGTTASWLDTHVLLGDTKMGVHIPEGMFIHFSMAYDRKKQEVILEEEGDNVKISIQ